VGWTTNLSDTGVLVNGAGVTAYGLFVEHFQKFNVLWNGERGRTVFFQNEMPYDPPDQAAWSHDGVLGFAAYKVADNVRQHEAWATGAYCFFQVNPSIHATRAFEVPVTAGVKFHDLLTVSLGGVGTIDHVINDTGAAAQGSSTIPVKVVGFHAVPGPCDPAVLVDQERRADDAGDGLPVHHLLAVGAVGLGRAVAGVAEQGELEAVLAAKALVAGAAVCRDADHIDVEAAKCREGLVELAGFLGAAGRVVLRIEVDDDPASLEAVEVDQTLVLVGQPEGRGGVAGVQTDAHRAFLIATPYRTRRSPCAARWLLTSVVPGADGSLTLIEHASIAPQTVSSAARLEGRILGG
jgi:hypothetical protein